MKKLQMLAASVALTLLLSAYAFADDGIMSTGKTPPPPQAVSTAQSDAVDTDGIITTGAPAVDPVAEVASALLQGVLALF
jgi:zona occludens toxin (predicted ATPase)